MESTTIKCNQGSVYISALDSDGEVDLTIFGINDSQVEVLAVYVDKARAEKIISTLKERFGLQ